MKLIKTLLLSAALIVVPTLAMAGAFDGFDGFDGSDDVGQDDAFDDVSAAVPEPTGALLMATGLVVVGLASRKRRR